MIGREIEQERGEEGEGEGGEGGEGERERERGEEEKGESCILLTYSCRTTHQTSLALRSNALFKSRGPLNRARSRTLAGETCTSRQVAKFESL